MKGFEVSVQVFFTFDKVVDAANIAEARKEAEKIVASWLAPMPEPMSVQVDVSEHYERTRELNP